MRCTAGSSSARRMRQLAIGALYRTRGTVLGSAKILSAHGTRRNPTRARRDRSVSDAFQDDTDVRGIRAIRDRPRGGAVTVDWPDVTCHSEQRERLILLLIHGLGHGARSRRAGRALAGGDHHVTPAPLLGEGQRYAPRRCRRTVVGISRTYRGVDDERRGGLLDVFELAHGEGAHTILRTGTELHLHRV